MTLKKLFTPYTLGSLSLPHRVIMAPMTRCRSEQPGNIPGELMKTYYAQRSSAALMITEATQISTKGQGYSFTPGIHTDEQEWGWRTITKAVHERGGRIFLQLWHVGRLSHESFHEDGLPIAPSSIAPDARVWIADEKGVGHMLPCPKPKAMTIEEIETVIDQFRQSAKRAIRAGFDGVEVHGANGYLIDQFLRQESNTRTDAYGGTKENRTRFALDVARAICKEIGPDKTGIRLSPFIRQKGMNDPSIVETVLYVAKQLQHLEIAYLHLAEADWATAPLLPQTFYEDLRSYFKGSIIVAGGYTAERAESLLQSNLADLVAFGRPFIANPDLPLRLDKNLPLASFDSTKLYGGDHRGYIDYPAYDGSFDPL